MDSITQKSTGDIMENGWMVKEMDMVFMRIINIIDIKVILKMISDKGKAKIFTKMVIHMKDNSKKTKDKDKESIALKMEIITKDNGSKDYTME